MGIGADKSESAKRYSNIPPSAGKILISEPFMQDFYFRRSVVLIADHSQDGTFGLIINKPVDLKFNDIIKGFPSYNGKLFLGGPVKTSNLYFIHTLGDVVEGSLRIMDGLYWGGDIDIIKDMLSLGQLNENDIRFFIGYAGWVPDQLDRELDEKSWVVSNTDKNTLLHSNPEDLWKISLRKLGKEFSLWANFPPDPMLN